jgi:hypothetical protein
VKNRILLISLTVMLTLSVGLVGCASEQVPEVTEYTLTISSTEGGSVTTPGEDTYTYDEGEVVDLLAEADVGYEFVNWTGQVDTIDDENAASTTITMNGDYSISASFIKQYDLTISSTTGGSVTTPGEATYTYDEREVVNLVAQAEGGHHFVNWTGEVSTIANVNATITSITMSNDYIITANFAVDLYFQTDAYVLLDGPATLPLEARTQCVLLNVNTNIFMDAVRVDLPGDGSVTVPAYTDLNSPEVDQRTVLRFCTCAAGMPTSGGEYIFTGLDANGEPIPEARNTDIWVGVQPPDPPTNVRAELTEDGILVSWDESPAIPGSFGPAAEPPLGSYQLWVVRMETGETVYGTDTVSAPPHLIPQDKANFIEGRDRGLSLGEMEDATYCLTAGLHSWAPEGSLGWGCEYNCYDSGQAIIFWIRDGEITIQ